MADDILFDEGEDAQHTGAMVALLVPADVAEQLALEGGAQAADLHLTLAFWPDASALGAAGQQKVLAATIALANARPPVDGRISGVGRFDCGDRDAFYASYDAPALPALRQSLVSALQNLGVAPAANHGFDPHITLAWLKPGDDSPLDRMDERPVTMTQLVVAFGDSRQVLSLLGQADSCVAMSCLFDEDTEVGCFSEDDSLTRYGVLKGPGGVEVPWIEKPALLFEAGTHKGTKYTEADLDAMVQTFRKPQTETDYTVPVQLGHPRKGEDGQLLPHSPRDTVGSLREVFRSGKRLWGIVRSVGRAAVENVVGGLWTRLSIEHRSDRSLKAVAITPNPYFPTAQMFDESEGDTPVPKSKKDEMDEKDEKDESSAEEEKAESPSEEKAEKAEAKKPAPKAKKAKEYSEGDDDQAAMFAEMERRFEDKFERQYASRIAALETESAAQRAENDRLRKERHFAECEELVMSFGEDGKTSPAMAKIELELVKTFSEDQLGLYRKLKAAQPDVVPYGRVSRPDVRKPGQQFGEEDVKTQVSSLLQMFPGPGATAART